MKTNDICTLEQSKALKQLGFHSETYHYYAKNGNDIWLTNAANWPNDWNTCEEREPPFITAVCSAPFLWVAQKWLREKKEIDIDIRSTRIGRKYDYVIGEETRQIFSKRYFDTYEESLSAGITQAITLLNQQKK